MRSLKVCFMQLWKQERPNYRRIVCSHAGTEHPDRVNNQSLKPYPRLCLPLSGTGLHRLPVFKSNPPFSVCHSIPCSVFACSLLTWRWNLTTIFLYFWIREMESQRILYNRQDPCSSITYLKYAQTCVKPDKIFRNGTYQMRLANCCRYSTQTHQSDWLRRPQQWRCSGHI